MVSCAERREYREALSRAQDIIEARPDSALMILDSLGQHSAEFGYRFRMKYLLYRTYAEAKTGVLFDTDSLTRELVDYFGNRSSGNEPMLAYYMHGCALMDIGRAPEALQSLYDAINRADTVNNLSAYHILRGIYGQMADIFHRQNLPQDEIWAWTNQIECVQKIADEVAYVKAKGQLIRPYFLLNETDTVLALVNEEYRSLLRLGMKKEAADALGPTISIYTECGQIEKAKNALDIYRNESGRFDGNGNIEPGYEGYYFIKGYFDLASGNIDSAEWNFRNAIEYGYLSEGYKGLLHVYRERGDMDSIVHFSVMYEAAQDTLHDRMRTDAIHQMASLYNYTRSEKEAEIAREQVRKHRWWSIIIAVAASALIIGILLYDRKRAKERKHKMAQLERELNLAQDARKEIQEELLQLKAHDYEAVIASKETQLAELSATIERMQAENDAYQDDSAEPQIDNPEQFRGSDIAVLFLDRAAKRKPAEICVSDSDWNRLVSQFHKDNPVTYRRFTSGKGLTSLEQHVCILLILDIPESAIALLTKSSSASISNTKARANDKLFGKKDASSLRANLLRALRKF